MEPSNNKINNSPKRFFIVGLLLLISGMFWGIMGALQYVIPGFLKEHISFENTRPMHVSSLVFWIILAAIGAVLMYVQEHTGKKIFSTKLVSIQYLLFVIVIPIILTAYCLGFFGGREYWEFPPILGVPILITWILFLINFLKSIKTLNKQPVYVWMWLTGIVFFVFTYLESYLWLIPYFGDNIVNDMTVQWKSYGSMVGSWNMLIYGSSIFLMDKISGDKKYSYSSIAFALYFLGLFNLMFNWGHHIYTLPTHGYIKHVSYAVSMTELILLGRIIYFWKKSLITSKKYFHFTAYRFYAAADVWIFLTLGLAVAMSIPAINVYTHGTHITVAHTMGATIGINSFLLLAFVFDQLNDTCKPITGYERFFRRGFWISNISLLIFWLSLIIAGVIKARWQMSESQVAFGTMMIQLRPLFILFLASGILMFFGFLMILVPLLKNQWQCSFKKQKTEEYRSTKNKIIITKNFLTTN